MNWIGSGGGPLICLGHSVIQSWKGVDGLGEPRYLDRGFRTDYERACAITEYLGAISVFGSTGLVLGDMPLDTTVLSINGLPLIVRVFYSEVAVDIHCMLAEGAHLESANEVEKMVIRNQEENWCIFDSAYPGSEVSGTCLSMFIPLGEFLIKTYEYMPDQNTSLLIHQLNYTRN